MLFENELFLSALRNTGIFCGIAIPLGMAIALLLVLVLKKQRRGRILLILLLIPLIRSIWNGDCFLEIFVWEKWFSGWVFTAFWKKHVRYWEFQMGHFDYYPDVSVEKYQFFRLSFSGPGINWIRRSIMSSASWMELQGGRNSNILHGSY